MCDPDAYVKMRKRHPERLARALLDDIRGYLGHDMYVYTLLVAIHE